MTDVGELVARIRVDSSGATTGARAAASAVNSATSQMRSSVDALKNSFRELLPALTVGAIVEFGRNALEAADHINDLAQRIGFAGSTLSALNIPLKQSGSNLDEFAASVNRMNAMIGEAAKGTNQEAVKAFDSLGLSVRKLLALSPEQQFFAIAKALGEQGTQAQMTEKGMNIFGRSFSALIPLIKEAKGNLQGFTDEMKRNGNALTDEELKRIDEWGDRWTAAIAKAQLALVNYLDYFYKLGQAHRQMIDDLGLPSNVSHSPGKVLSNDEAAKSIRDGLKAKGIAVPGETSSAQGGNADLLREKSSALKEYIANLQAETSAIGLSDRALFVQRAEIEASDKAKEDWNNHLRASKDLTDGERAKIEQLTGSFYDLKKAQQENERQAKMMKDALSDALADIVVNFDSLKDSATSAIQAIAKEIIKAKLTTPLASGIIDALPSFSMSSLFSGFFAAGGDPPVGKAAVVGENGPELFVPKTAGTVIPNHALGGSVVVQQTIHLSPGLPETVNAAIARAAPAIAAQAQAGVFRAIERGGSAAQAVGRRNG